eukprot:4441320-Karenia_brevis.AAC.1
MDVLKALEKRIYNIDSVTGNKTYKAKLKIEVCMFFSDIVAEGGPSRRSQAFTSPQPQHIAIANFARQL